MQPHHLLDGKITADEQIAVCSEAIFTPSMVGEPCSGLHTLIFDTIASIGKDSELRDLPNALYKNIIVCGGGSMHKGFIERLQYELTRIKPEEVELCVIRPADSPYLAWKGAAQMVKDGKVNWLEQIHSTCK